MLKEDLIGLILISAVVIVLMCLTKSCLQESNDKRLQCVKSGQSPSVCNEIIRN